MSLTVTFKGGTKFDIVSRKHQVVTDQPFEDGGTDGGMSPVELFIGSLAGCVGYFVARYCARHDIPADGLTIETGWSMAEQPHRIGAVEMTVRLPAALTPSQRERLLKVAHGCTVHQSLAVPPNVAMTLLTADQP